MSTILLVDDNEDIRKIFTLVLSRNGHTVHSAPGDRECLEQLATVAPDIILLDIMMPGMDGWETLLAIKQDPSTRGLPVAMCSGKPLDKEEIIRYGKYIEDYLVKPLELAELSDTLVGIRQRYATHRAEMEHLKHEISDHHLVDEFYDCQKTLLILEKYSLFFTADPEKIGSVVRNYQARMQEIRDVLHLPVLSGTNGTQPGIRDLHSGAGTTVDNGTGVPGSTAGGSKEINPVWTSSRRTQ